MTKVQTSIRCLYRSAARMAVIPNNTIDLVVTSPPYPVVAMWDDCFATQDPRIATALARADGKEAFEHMHRVLDSVWDEVCRCIRPGGIVCINIGDATRSLFGDFQLYPNHVRIVQALRHRGLVLLPDILWRKPNNAPSKFMGSGMLPVGAYVTYEHEYILILRCGKKREFLHPQEKHMRRQSAFFWEERNIWFSDVWHDIPGATQKLSGDNSRPRSGAFPFDLAYRLICMFSIKGDVVLDPFMGTGTTLVAAAGRHATGFEIEAGMSKKLRSLLAGSLSQLNDFNLKRLRRHEAFISRRLAEGGNFKYTNDFYGFPVTTSQEQELLINEIVALQETGDSTFTTEYSQTPQKQITDQCESGLAHS